MRKCPKCGSTEIKKSSGNAKGCSWLFAVLFIMTAYKSCDQGIGFILTCLGLSVGLYFFGKHYESLRFQCMDCRYEENINDFN
jgi:hypothetical protein